MFHRSLLLAKISLLLAAVSVVQAAEPEYGLREAQPRIGSAIRRFEVYGSQLPINKRYHEFTQEERAMLNQSYERVEPGDEPPFPADGLRPIYDTIRKAQAKLLVSGKLILIVEVNASGDATAVKAVGSPSPEMTKFAASLLMLTKYKPAICGGKPCPMEFPFDFNFQVR